MANLGVSATIAGRLIKQRLKDRRLPSVDVPQTESDEVRRTLENIAEHLRMYEGSSGAPKERFVTIAELEQAGLITAGVKSKFAYISKVQGQTVDQPAGKTVIERTITTSSGGSGGGTGGALNDLSDVNAIATTGHIVRFNGTIWTSVPESNFAAAGHGHDGVYSPVGHTHVEADITDLGAYLENIVEDTTPELGGNLAAGDNNIDALGNIDFGASLGDKVYYYSNTYYRGIESGTLYDRVASNYRVYVGATPDGGASATLKLTTQIFEVGSFQFNIDQAVGVGQDNYVLTYDDASGQVGLEVIPTQTGTTNLSYTAGTRTVASDTGTDAVLPIFTATDAGLAPASGGGTTAFLRADGTWATPGGGGTIGGSIADNQIAVGAAVANDIEGDPDLTWNGTTLSIGNNAFSLSDGTDSFTFSATAGWVEWVTTGGGSGVDFGTLQVRAPILRLKEQANAYGDLATYGQLWVRNDATQNLFFTDEAGADLPVGLNAMPPVVISASQNMLLSQVGRMLHKNAGVAITLTCAQDAATWDGATWVVHNDDTEDLTIAAGASVTVYWLEGGTAPAAGSVTVKQGGVVTVYKYSNTEFWVWGTKDPEEGYLSNLLDVTITAVGNDEVLQFTGTVWENQTLAEAGIAAAVHTHVEADITDLGNYAVIGGAHHDGFSDYVANEHIDWTSTTSNFSTTGTVIGQYYEATGLGPLTTPGTDDLYVGGYGIAGSRTQPVYVTNFAGPVALNYAGSHGNSKKLETTTNGVNILGSLFLDEQASAAADVTNDGQIWVRNDSPNTLWYTGETGLDRPIGFNAMPVVTISASQNFLLAEVGYMMHKSSGVAVTLTCAQDASTWLGATWVVHNDDTEDLTIAQGAGVTIYWLEGGSAPAPGNVTVEQGGVVTVYKLSATEFWVWGTKEASGTNLAGLDDVIITSPTTGDLLRYNGTNWVNYADSNYAAASHTHVQADITDLDIIGGSITDNQIAVGAAAADHIEGSADLTWDGTTFNVHGNSGPQLTNWTSSLIPTLVPRSDDSNSGFGWASADEVNVVAGGVEMMRWINDGTSTTRYLVAYQPHYLSERAAAHNDLSNYGQIWVRNDAPNTLWFTGDTGLDRPVGFNSMPVVAISASQNFLKSQVGYMMHKNAGGALTFTCAQDSTTWDGATWIVHNDDTEDLTIAAGASVTVYWLEGGAAPAAGNVTVKQGGVVTVYKLSNTEFWCWGTKDAFTGGGINNVVEDTTPQLGGDLDLQTFGIVTSSNATAGEIVETTIAGSFRITNGTQFADIGPRNASYCHFETNASSGFYFYDNITGATEIRVIDNAEMAFGSIAGGDARMYFNATDLYLDMNAAVDFRLRGGAAGTDPMITTIADQGVYLYYNGSESLRTQLATGSSITSSVLIKDHTNTSRDAGFNHVKEIAQTTANITLDNTHAGCIIRRTGTSNVSVTMQAGTTEFPVGSMVTVLNHGTGGTHTISDGSEAMYIMDGSGTVADSTGFALAIGGAITIWRQGTSAYYVWGTGIP